MKTKLRNLLIFVLILVIFAQLLLSCSPAKVDNPAENENNVAQENDAEEKTDEITDDIPVLNFNGETVNVIYRDYMAYETYAEANSSEVISDAVYKRNLAVEERFNVKFNFIEVRGAWDYKDEFLKRIRNSVSAGDDEFDIIEGYAAYIVELVTSGNYLRNWKEIPYIGFDKPWWNKQFIEEITINDKTPFLTGDLALSTISMANVLFFNKNMWQAYALEDPYSIVKEGKWTLDKMAEFTKNVAVDIDNDGKWTERDMYGYVTDTHNQIDAYVEAFDIPITIMGEDKLPVLVVEDEKFATAFLKLYSFIRENISTFAGTEQPTATDIYSTYRPMFQDQRALILAEYLGNSAQMRSYDFDFGILPFPKLDEKQEKYRTKSQDGYTMFCTPVTVQNTEKVGAVIEALAAESRKSVVPAFYDVALKTKYARDEESSDMIDIIRDGIGFNFGILYVLSLGNVHLEWRFLITNKQNNIVSSVEKKIKTWNKNLAKVLTAYED